MRADSPLTRSNAVRYHSALRGSERARLVFASMTESGVRSSWEASAEKSSWRRRATSMGVATRRPTKTAPPKTNDKQDGADEQLGEHEVRLGPADVGDVLSHHEVAAGDVGACDPDRRPVDGGGGGAVTAISPEGSDALTVVRTVPSLRTSQARTGGPSGRSCGLSGGSSPPPPDGGWDCVSAEARRSSTCRVRLVDTMAKKAMATMT